MEVHPSSHTVDSSEIPKNHQGCTETGISTTLSSHNHGSVETESPQYESFLSFRVSVFHWTMIMGERGTVPTSTGFRTNHAVDSSKKNKQPPGMYRKPQLPTSTGFLAVRSDQSDGDPLLGRRLEDDATPSKNASLAWCRTDGKRIGWIGIPWRLGIPSLELPSWLEVSIVVE